LCEGKFKGKTEEMEAETPIKPRPTQTKKEFTAGHNGWLWP